MHPRPAKRRHADGEVVGYGRRFYRLLRGRWTAWAVEANLLVASISAPGVM